MSDLSGRLFNVAKAYLNSAKERLSEIDAQAQEELSRALNYEDRTGVTASADPMERARAKIASAQTMALAQRDMQAEVTQASPAPALTTDPVHTAYKVLGLPQGADSASVQDAVERLRERCAPSKFPDGSPERSEAVLLLSKVEDANQMLRASLNAGAGRFDKLEI